MSNYENKLNSLNEHDRNLAESYFAKASVLQKMFGVVRSKFEFKDPFGNFNSKVVVVLDFEKLDDKILKLVKKFYEINGQEFNNIYITPYHKTINNQINDKLLYKELEVMKPDRVISFGVDNLNLGSESVSMSKADYDYFYDCIGDATKINSDEYKAVKSVFTNMMKFVITGGR